MKILNQNNKAIGEVNNVMDGSKVKPFVYEYKNYSDGERVRVYANDEAMACKMVCQKLGEGYFYLLFTI